MTPEQWRRVTAVFHEALLRAPASRDAFLDEACGNDPGVRTEVHKLLAGHGAAGLFGAVPAQAIAGARPLAAEPDTHAAMPVASATTTRSTDAQSVGPYRLLELIGEGGMGEVWLAEQLHPLRRQVAVKLIRRGMDSRHVIARFEAERQALALMDHPAIATVFDGGTTSDGRLYFAMEYVKGEPITTYCDRLRLSTDERVELFIQVCEGVQHAHQKGVIHRDLKPSNVLVTLREDRAVPKIIDFGIAKAVAQPLTDQSLHTALGSLIGTPGYISPEQTESGGLDVDTRTDIYALGVILYELLTGALPIAETELRDASLLELMRLIREKEPLRPSTRVSQLGAVSSAVSHCHRSDPQKLVSRLRGDLDWITMKALEKDRTRRYGTASTFAADLRHHLLDEPVVAGPPTARYRAKKFVRRHRLGVVTSALTMVALVAVAVTVFVQAGRIARERDRANLEAVRASREAEASRQVTDFLVGLFKVSDPGEARGNAVTAREILDRGAARIASELSAQPEVQAVLMSTMGTVYQSLGIYKEAAALLTRSLEARRRLFGNDNALVATTLHDLGTLKVLMGDYDEGRKALSEALALRERLLGANSVEVATTTGSLGILAYERGEFGRAESFFRRQLEVLRAASTVPGEKTADALNDLAMTIQMVRADYDEAKALLRESLDIRRNVLGATHPSLGQSLNNLAMAHYRAKEFEAAEPLFREALERNRASFGDAHPEVAASLSSLALVLRERGAYAEANALWARALEMDRTLLGGGHQSVGISLAYWGESLRRSGDAKGGETKLREALAVFAATLAPNHMRAVDARTLLAMCFVDQRRFAEAETLLLPAHAILATQFSADHARVVGAVERLVALYDAWARREKAAEWRSRLPATSRD
jgi:serine/threonine protein kinase/tetratricopeptide (TPR) repeat protein